MTVVQYLIFFVLGFFFFFIFVYLNFIKGFFGKNFLLDFKGLFCWWHQKWYYHAASDIAFRYILVRLKRFYFWLLNFFKRHLYSFLSKKKVRRRLRRWDNRIVRFLTFLYSCFRQARILRLQLRFFVLHVVDSLDTSLDFVFLFLFQVRQRFFFFFEKLDALLSFVIDFWSVYGFLQFFVSFFLYVIGWLFFFMSFCCRYIYLLVKFVWSICSFRLLLAFISNLSVWGSTPLSFLFFFKEIVVHSFWWQRFFRSNFYKGFKELCQAFWSVHFELEEFRSASKFFMHVWFSIYLPTGLTFSFFVTWAFYWFFVVWFFTTLFVFFKKSVAILFFLYMFFCSFFFLVKVHEALWLCFFKSWFVQSKSGWLYGIAKRSFFLVFQFYLYLFLWVCVFFFKLHLFIFFLAIYIAFCFYYFYIFYFEEEVILVSKFSAYLLFWGGQCFCV